MYVSKQILDQINAIDPMALYAWGVRNISVGKVDGRNEGVILHGVKGSKTKGKTSIMVILNALDLYTIKMYRHKRYAEIELVREIPGVYAEDLVKTIDELVG